MGTLIRFDDPIIQSVLSILLQDKTMKRNIIWATDSFTSLGEYYRDSGQITAIGLRSLSPESLQPRIFKAQAEQQQRTRKHGEVQTPAWLCCKMNDYLDETWYERKNVFNVQDGHTWAPAEGKIVFPKHRHSSWRQYVDSRRLEITCGEAPFIVSRYDAATGAAIPIERRIGLLDRKLRIVCENTDSEAEWVKWAIRAIQSVYGYEYQGDNLLIARINVLMTFVEYLQSMWYREPTEKELATVANIISWNFWQMDGLTGTVPKGKLQSPEARPITMEELGWFAAIDGATSSERPQEQETTPPCRVCNWRQTHTVTFDSLKTHRGRDVRNMKFDFVIGNPPYQQETSNEITTNGQRSRKNIFQYFQIAADNISTEGSVLVYPGGRWIHQSGKGLRQFGQDLINDKRLAKLKYFARSGDIFANTDIPDGISIVVKKQNKTEEGFEYTYYHQGQSQSIKMKGPGEELMPINPKDTVILNKISDVLQRDSIPCLHDAILPRSLFSIESDFVEKNPSRVREYHDGMGYDSSKQVKLFTNDKAGAAGRSKWFLVERNILTQSIQYISEWQVVVSSAHPGGQDGRDNQLAIIDNNSAFGRARVALRSFKSKEEAENFFRYMKTYLVRFTLLMTDESLTSLAKRVPDFEDYSYTNTILDFKDDLDSQLFSYFSLTEDDITYIKEVVDNSGRKEMT